LCVLVRVSTRYKQLENLLSGLDTNIMGDHTMCSDKSKHASSHSSISQTNVKHTHIHTHIHTDTYTHSCALTISYLHSLTHTRRNVKAVQVHSPAAPAAEAAAAGKGLAALVQMASGSPLASKLSRCVCLCSCITHV